MIFFFLPRVLVTVVFNVSDGAIGLVQSVVTLDDITITVLMLGLDVSGVGVLYLVSELVFGVRLKYWKYFI